MFVLIKTLKVFEQNILKYIQNKNKDDFENLFMKNK